MISLSPADKDCTAVQSQVAMHPRGGYGIASMDLHAEAAVPAGGHRHLLKSYFALLPIGSYSLLLHTC